MAGDFDGEKFIGIDDAAFGDGQTDATTKPLSTWLENRLDGNARYLQQRGGTVTYQFFSGETEGIRPFTSIEQSALFSALIPLRDDMKTVTLYLLAECDNDSATTGKVDVEARVSTPNQATPVTATATVTETGAVEVTTLTLDLSDERLDAQLGTVSLWIQSAARSTPGSFTAVIQPQNRHISDLTDVTDVTQIDATSTYVVEDQQPVATLHTFDDGAKIWLSDLDNTAFGLADPDDMGVTELSYLRPQSITVDIEYDEEGAGEGYQRKDASTMRAQSTVLGQHVPAHGSNLDEIRTRLRPLAFGPPGEDEGENWPTDHYRKWSWILDESGDTRLDEQTLQLTADDPSIWCFARMAILRQKEPNVDEGELFYREVFYADTDIEGYNKSRATADVDFRVRVRQLDDGDTAWSNAATLADKTETQPELGVFPMTAISEIPLAAQAWFARVPGVVSSNRSGGDCASDYNYGFREGQLYEGDRRIILPVLIKVDLDSPATRVDPVRATLEWGGLSNIDLPSGEQSVDDHQYHAICLQTTWLEEVSF